MSLRKPCQGLTHPEVVHEGDDALELLTDFHIDVLVEAGPHGAEGGQRRPVVLAGWERKKKTYSRMIKLHFNPKKFSQGKKKTATAHSYACANYQIVGRLATLLFIYLGLSGAYTG